MNEKKTFRKIILYNKNNGWTRLPNTVDIVKWQSDVEIIQCSYKQAVPTTFSKYIQLNIHD